MLRRLAFLLVTLLLIARGLLGAAAAMGLTVDAGALPPAAAVSGQSALYALTLPEGAHHDSRTDHGDHASVAQASPAQHCGGKADTGHCAEPQGHSAGACAACGLCHPASLAPSPGLASPAAAPAAPPAERSARFASAHRTRTIRPPIAGI